MAKLPTLPLNFFSLRKTLIDEVQRVTGLTCIVDQPETQGVNRPIKPYMSLRTIGPAVKKGDDAHWQNPGTRGWNVGGQRKMTVQFNCFGNEHEEAYNYMSVVQSALETETTQANLRAGGIAVWLNGNVNDLSLLLNTGFEGRSQMDVAFGVAANVNEDLSYIESVTVTGEVTSDQGEETTLTDTVTQP